MASEEPFSIRLLANMSRALSKKLDEADRGRTPRERLALLREARDVASVVLSNISSRIGREYDEKVAQEFATAIDKKRPREIYESPQNRRRKSRG